MKPVVFKTYLDCFDNDVYGLHLPVPEDVAASFIGGEDRRVICLVNGKHKMHSGLMAAKPYWFLLLNQQVVKKLGLSLQDEVEVKMEKDTSEYGMEMPEELQEAMNQDPTATEYFRQLTPGKQRNLIYLVSKVKNVQSRVNKALAIMHHLNEVEGKVDFKMLNETIKEYNKLR